MIGGDGGNQVENREADSGSAAPRLQSLEELLAIERERGLSINGETALHDRVEHLSQVALIARSLARCMDGTEAREAVCELAAGLVGADVVALAEMRSELAGLLVTASTGADLDGISLPFDQAGSTSRALADGTTTFSSAIPTEPVDESTWPLAGTGVASGLWQPIRRSVGLRGVLAVGWREQRERPSQPLLDILEVLAEEASVAIDRTAAFTHMSGMARTDPLTDLANRRSWQEELGREIARADRTGRGLCVAYLDLDEFKGFNDRWGHAAGDRLLLTAAVRWSRRLRITDVLGRLGGDEFAVTLPGAGLEEAKTIADELRDVLPDGVSCSIGVTEWIGGEDVRTLLERADQALYEAKRAGRNMTIARPAGPR